MCEASGVGSPGGGAGSRMCSEPCFSSLETPVSRPNQRLQGCPMIPKSRNTVETQARTRNPNDVDSEPHSPCEPHFHPALAASLRRGRVRVLESSCLEDGLPPSALSASPSPVCDSNSQRRC